MIIKIKTHEYEITRQDRFMDNKYCIQLLTQSKEPLFHQDRPHPTLPKRVVKQIEKIKRVDVQVKGTVTTFSLDV